MTARRRRGSRRSSRAISAGCCPPSVRVRISMRSLIDRLVAARIGRTDELLPGRRRRRAPARPARRTISTRARARRCSSSARRRATAARAISGLPFTSERQLTGAGPAEATATIVQRVLAELGLDRRGAALERRSDASRDRDVESRARRAPRSPPGAAFAVELAARAARGRGRPDRARRARRRRTSGTRRTAAPRRSPQRPALAVVA